MSVQNTDTQNWPPHDSSDDAETDRSSRGGIQQHLSRSSSPTNLQSLVTKIKSSCIKRYDVAVLCVVIVVVWGLLALPTIFYHLPEVRT